MKRGFTLVELLVVIAIITILAAIITPNVTGYIARGQATRAFGEIQQIETAMTAMLTDAERADFSGFFTQEDQQTLNEINAQTVLSAGNIYETYSDIMYALLRTGRRANAENLPVSFNERILDKLGSGYIDIGRDPWDEPYQFYLGRIARNEIMPFRSFREGNEPDNDLYEPFIYTGPGPDDLPGAPRANIGSLPPGVDARYGRPADRNNIYFVWSKGENLQSNQLPFNQFEGDPLFYGGGDDINSWDNEQGWRRFYAD